MAILPPSELAGVAISILDLASTIPGTISDSLALPSLIIRRFTLSLSRSAPPSSPASASAASRAMSVRWAVSDESTFPAREVATTARLSAWSCDERATRSISAKASSRAIWYPFMITEGCTPERTNSSAFCSISDVRMTVVVVPSRAARSWAEEVDIRSRAVGCSTLAVSSTVTPSLVTVVEPPSSTSILSSPRGPRVERTAPARATAASTLLTRAERPCRRSVSSKATSCSDSTIANRRTTALL